MKFTHFVNKSEVNIAQFLRVLISLWYEMVTKSIRTQRQTKLQVRHHGPLNRRLIRPEI